MIDGGKTTWWLVQWGMYVRDLHGEIWRVDGRRLAGTGEAPTLEFRLANPEGKQADVLVGHDDEVTIMIPTLEEAEAIIAARLPVASVQRRVIRMETLAEQPNSKWHRRHIASHLLEMHGLSISPTADIENGDIAGLIEAHALAHAEPWRILIPHVHVPFHEL